MRGEASGRRPAASASRRRVRRGAVGALLLAAGLAATATAFVPPAPKVADAVAEANERGGRTRPLRLAVTLHDALGEEKARGEALLDPRGEATLELRTPDGSVERHRLVGGREWADQDGGPRVPERPLLAPLALLQVGRGEDLLALLGFLGGAPGEIDLGLEGPHDCYVLGGRGLPPLPPLPRPSEESTAGGDAAGAPVAPAPLAPRPPVAPVPPVPAGPRAALWVDSESFDPVRIDRSDGVRFRLGAMRVYQNVRFPSRIDVEAPGRPPWQLVIEDVAPARRESRLRGGPARRGPLRAPRG